MVKKENKQKSPWFYIAIIVGIIALLIVILVSINPNYQSSPNTNPPAKNIYTYTASGINEKTYLDRPNDQIIIVLSGIGNVLTISNTTEVLSITLSGSNNLIQFCNGGYATPDFVKSGINNQITNINCN